MAPTTHTTHTGKSVLRSVSWSVGRHGRLSPIGHIDPVSLGGYTVSAVGLHGMSWIREQGLILSSRIVISRTGDTPPHIIEVLHA